MAEFAVPTLPMRDPRVTDHTCYIYVDDLEAAYAAFKASNVGKLMPIEMKPWGVREFVLIEM